MQSMNTTAERFRNYKLSCDSRTFPLNLTESTFYVNRQYLILDWQCAAIDLESTQFQFPDNVMADDVISFLNFIHAGRCGIEFKQWEGVMLVSSVLKCQTLLDGIGAGIAASVKQDKEQIKCALRALRWYSGDLLENIFVSFKNRVNISFSWQSITKQDYEFICMNQQLITYLLAYAANLQMFTHDNSNWLHRIKTEHREEMTRLYNTFVEVDCDNDDAVLLKFNARWGAAISPVFALEISDQDSNNNCEHEYLRSMVMNEGVKVWPMLELFYPTTYSCYLRLSNPSIILIRDYYDRNDLAWSLNNFHRAFNCMSLCDQFDISGGQENICSSVKVLCNQNSNISQDQALKIGLQFSYLPLISFGLKHLSEVKFDELFVDGEGFKLLGKDAIVKLTKLVLFDK